MAPKQAAGLPSKELLEELALRFVLIVPAEELRSFERMLFLIEQAHWFYEDFHREQRTDLKSLSLREFAELMFSKCDLLKPYAGHIEEIYKRFTAYKHHIPVHGAILLNKKMTLCLMVRGWKSGSSWGFPRGKMNKEEADAACAAREVEEEIGYDVAPFLEEQNKLVYTQGGQKITLYVVAGFDEMTPFAPQTRKEVGAIAWHPVKDLPNTHQATGVAGKGANNNKYFMVHPFSGPLRQWIATRKQLVRQGVALPAIPLESPSMRSGAVPAAQEAPQPVAPQPAVLQPPQRSAWLNFAFDRGPILQALG